MRVYEVKGPCPELGVVLAKIAAEAEEGEVVKIVSKWRYILNDVTKSGRYIGLEVLDAREAGDVVEVLVKKSRRGQPLGQARET
ncbi:MAG: sulfurtransferase TusA family protein [Pyrobaculum sp.]